jgi:hypothetical protein
MDRLDARTLVRSARRSHGGCARRSTPRIGDTSYKVMVETGRRTIIAKGDRAEGSRTEVAAVVR